MDQLLEVEAQVRAWLDAAATKRVHPSARRLAALLKDPGGLEFAVGFVDRVVRPEDTSVAGKALRELGTPTFLPWPQRVALRVGAFVSRFASWLVIPVARRVLRRMVGHLLIDASDSQLGKEIARLRSRRVSLNVNLLGEAVLGAAEANRRLAGTADLLRRPDVDYVSLKVSAAVAPQAPWAHEAAVAEIVDRLLPQYRYAATAPSRKFINLDMEEYENLETTVEVFQQLLDREELLGLEAGIAIQAYLPDAMGVMIRLQNWSAARRARGGAPIKVRLVKGANLPMERVEASLHGWPLVTWDSKQATDTSYKRVLDYALTPERIANVRVGVAGHNLFDVAHAWLLAGERGVRDGVDFEMLLGMAEGQAQAVRETVGRLLLYVPVVHPRDFDVAIAYLVRRLEEGATPDNFMSAAFEIGHDEELFARERDRYVASVADLGRAVPRPNRTQDRRDPVVHKAKAGFANTQDSDPSLAANRAWAVEIINRVADSKLGVDLVEQYAVDDLAGIERLTAEAAGAGEAWGALTGRARANVLRAAAIELESRRGDLLEVAASECGKTLDQADPEVSEAIDFLNYYAEGAERLDEVDGATAVPVRLTLVTPPWNFPIAIPLAGTAAALAAGSAVIVKPAPQAARCGSVLVDALWAAGVPREVLRLAHVPENDAGRALVASPHVDRVILTGAFETAAAFREFRPDLPLLAETSGKNAIVITPSADLDVAVRDLVQSAFGHAGQKCSAASLGILVGSVGRSPRFRRQLIDAVTSLKVGLPSDPRTQVGPIIEPASGKLLRALTSLGPGESWLVEPRRLDTEGRLWSPGVKAGVRRRSEFHLTEYFGPVLGLVEAADLEEAIDIQNETDYGLTAGLQSLDRAEIAHWIDRVEAGNAYVNRTTVGAIVRRQPFGGWKKSSVGPGAKAGGPNYLISLSDWSTARATASAPVDGWASAALAAAAHLRLDDGFLSRSLQSDAAAWRDEFGVTRDVSGLTAERNILRYLPVPVTVRFEGGSPAELIRVVAAGKAARAAVTVSAGLGLSAAVTELLQDAEATVVEQDRDAWMATLAGPDAPARVRLLGGSRRNFAEASGGRADIALYAQRVVEAGRIEMLTFLREQSVSITAHRFGTPTALADVLG